MSNLTIQCEDPDALLIQISKAVLSVQAIDETRKIFENEVKAAGDGKIGAANQKLLDAIIEVGGAGLEATGSSLIVDLDVNLLTAAFDAYYAKYGERHSQDRRQ